MPVLYLHSSDNTGTGKTWVTELSVSDCRGKGQGSADIREEGAPREGMHTQRVPGAAHAASPTSELPEGAAGWSPSPARTVPVTSGLGIVTCKMICKSLLSELKDLPRRCNQYLNRNSCSLYSVPRTGLIH